MTMSRSCAKNCGVCLVVIGTIALVISAAGYLILPIIIHSKVVETVVIKNGTPTYPEFLEPSIPIYMQIYIFDLINVDEAMKGAKPYFVERGPYTYREYRYKFDLDWNKTEGHVTYKQNRTFHFDESLSVGSDNDTFTTANIPLLTLMFQFQNQSEIFKRLLSLILNVFPSETLFINRSVRDIIWGYTDPMLEFAHSVLKEMIPTDFVGVLTGMNDSYDGTYTVVTGVNDSAHLGQILAFNGSTEVPFWKTRYCRMVNGSDGSLAPPFLNKSSVLPIFVSDICRSVYGLYKDTTETKQGISIYRFTAPPMEMANASINPDNFGFCVPQCLPSGLIDLSSCKMIDGFHLPIVASYPHFLDGDPSLVEAVGGIQPDPEYHRTYTNMEPTTGIVMEIYKRLQINVKMKQVPGFERFGKVRSVFFPVMWLNESAVVDDELADMVKSMLLIPQMIANIAIYTLFGVAVLSYTICFIIGMRLYCLTRSGSVYVEVVNDNSHENFDQSPRFEQPVSEDEEHD